MIVKWLGVNEFPHDPKVVLFYLFLYVHDVFQIHDLQGVRFANPAFQSSNLDGPKAYQKSLPQPDDSSTYLQVDSLNMKTNILKS